MLYTRRKEEKAERERPVLKPPKNHQEEEGLLKPLGISNNEELRWGHGSGQVQCARW